MGIVIVIKSLGIVFALIGILYLWRPDFFKWLIGFFKQGNRMYIAGVIRFILAVVFLVGATECRYFWVILIFGIIFLLSGLLIFMLGPAKIRRMFEWYEIQSTILYRIIAFFVLAVGAVIIYSA